jgi:hypothetical protein
MVGAKQKGAKPDESRFTLCGSAAANLETTVFPLYMTNAKNTGHMMLKSRGHFYKFFTFCS